MLEFHLELISRRERRALALGAVALVLVAASALFWLGPALERTPTPAPSPVLVLAAQFDSGRSGWVALRSGIGPLAPSGIYRTTDAGRTWQPLPVPVKTPSAATLRFFDARRGALLLVRDESAGRASLYVTDDGGATWDPRPLPAAAAGEEVMSFLDPDHFVEVFLGAGADGPAVFRSADGGHSWARAALAGLPAHVVLLGPTFVDGGRGFAAVDALSGGARVYRTADGGDTWTVARTSAGFGALRQAMPVLAFGDVVMLPMGGTLAVSRDGGASFPELEQVPTGAATEAPIACLDQLHCRAAFDLDYASTEDGGLTWRSLRPRLPARLLLEGRLQPVDLRTAWAVASAGDGERLVETTDAGVSWREAPLPRL